MLPRLSFMNLVPYSHHPEAVTVSDRNLCREKQKLTAFLAVVSFKSPAGCGF